jgi:hypothetical protein
MVPVIAQISAEFLLVPIVLKELVPLCLKFDALFAKTICSCQLMDDINVLQSIPGSSVA